MKTLVVTPSTDPREAGPLAARSGNVYALRVAADQERDASREDTAAKLSLLAGELEVRTAQARQLRARLASMPDPQSLEATGNAPAKLIHIRWWADESGLPVELAMLSKSKVIPAGFLIIMPTDGESVAETADRLVAVFRRAFPTATFWVLPTNLPMSEAGREADKLLDELTDAKNPERAAA